MITAKTHLFVLVAASTLLVSPMLWAQESELSSAAAQRQLSHSAPRGGCKIAGNWIGSSPPFLPDLGDQTLIFAETITPLDSTCKRFSSVLTPVNPELTFSGLFPEATTASSAIGTLARVAQNVYRLDAITYFAAPPAGGLPIRGPIVYFWTYSGTVRCLDDECSTKLQEGILALYSNTEDPTRAFPPLGILGISDQDTNDDGFADEGELPIFEAPFPLASQRLKN